MRILEGWARLGLWTGFFWGGANEKNKSAERLESSFVVTKVPPVWMYYWKCLAS